jgi:S-adenosylmethionine:tRNA ribosyltransferase-isomerase
MLTTDFDFCLPENLIAQTPIEPRDHSRLMVIDRQKKSVEHRHFFDIIDYLRPGDVVVWNNSKVFKARLFGTPVLAEEIVGASQESTDIIKNSHQVEVFLVRPMENKGVWKILAKPARKLRLGMKIMFAQDFWCEVLLKEKDGTLLVQFPDDDVVVRAKANKYGEVPLPPYVAESKARNSDQKNLTERYQTVYAKYEGSVAAPTAGLHFTAEILDKVREKGVVLAEVTLHVGLGTFLPVKTDVVEEHQMHSEWVELTPETATVLNTAKRDGRRIIAVGTTTVRTLEGIALQRAREHNSAVPRSDVLSPFSGDLNIFITPGFKFRVVDALITNFHLPKSTLLMLVSAFVGDGLVSSNSDEGRNFTLGCYQEAVKEEYRFYSFGDAMIIT